VTPEAAKDVITPPNAGKMAPGEGTPKLPDIPPTEDDGGNGGNGNEGAVPKPSPEDDFAMLAKRFEALKKR
jgi:vacuolar protein sorting-associated protein IST1